MHRPDNKIFEEGDIGLWLVKEVIAGIEGGLHDTSQKGNIKYLVVVDKLVAMGYQCHRRQPQGENGW
jgi:hypothetical protein